MSKGSKSHKAEFGGDTIIRFDDVSFEYSQSKPILEEAGFNVRKGTKITIDAVTGPMFNLQNAFEGDLIQAQPTEPTQPAPCREN